MAAGSPGDDGPRYLFDKEGWRLNLFGERPSDDQLERDRQRQFERELQAAQERWEGGDLTAFAEALRRCHWYQRAPPRWLVEASEALVEAAMAEHEKRARREWRMHLTRWEAVTELRERRHELNKPTRVPNEHGEITLQRGDRGMTLDNAYDAVSEILKNDEAAGGPRAVEESYKLIEAAGGEDATFECYLHERRRRSKWRSKLGHSAPD